MDWDKISTEEFAKIALPKKGQGRNIHTGDAVCLIDTLRKEKKPRIIVEIGAAFGTSTKIFAAIAKAYGGEVISIECTPQKAWIENLKEYDLQDYAQMVKGTSPWIPWPETKNIDFLFIDGGHNFRNAFVDYFYWEKFVKVGGMIAFHDTKTFSGVRKTIDEILKTEPLTLVSKANSRTGLEIYKKIENKYKDTVFFGPWVGEFGFEVAWWQGFCRKESRKYSHTIVSTYPGNEGLYEDFADEIIAHNLTGNPMCGYLNNQKGEFEYPNVKKVYVPKAKKFIPKKDQEYIIFGQDNPNKSIDVILHISGDNRKNYSYWTELISFFKDNNLSYGCFGKTGNHPDKIINDAVDLRDKKIGDIAQYLNGCKLVVGPCSGAMHFASFCNANIVVWGDNRKYTWGQTLRQRFEDILNPHGNKVSVIDKYEWNPPVKVVKDEITRFL